MDRFSLLFCLATYLLASTEAALDAEGIVGGGIAPDDKYRFLVSIQDSTGFHFCGGAIIFNEWVLTAAHCVTNKTEFITEFKVRQVVAGLLELNVTDSNVTRVGVEEVYIPNEYNGGGSVGDIALLKLKRSLNLLDNKLLTRAWLPNENKTYAGENATIVGFGYTTVKKNDAYPNSEEGGYDTYKKKMADAKVLSNDECGTMWSTTIDAKQICAQTYQPTEGNKTAGVCAGDSGGPLVSDDGSIIGILSTSPGFCTEEEKPAVYTRVSAYLGFLKNIIHYPERIPLK